MCVCENAINKVRDIQRESKNRRQRFVKSYEQPRIAELIGAYEREEVEANVREGGPTIPKSSFATTGFVSPMGEGALEGIFQKATWGTTSGQGLQIVPGAWQLVFEMHRLSDWSLASPAWKATFMLEGFIVQRVGDEQLFLVLGSSHCCFVVWPLAMLNGRLGKYAVPKPVEGTQYSSLFVSDFNLCKVWPYQVVSPMELEPHDIGTRSIAVLLEGKSFSIMEAGGKVGFKGVTQQWSEKACAYHG